MNQAYRPRRRPTRSQIADTIGGIVFLVFTWIGIPILLAVIAATEAQP